MKSSIKNMISILLVLSLTLGVSAVGMIGEISTEEVSDKFYEAFTLPNESSEMSVMSTETGEVDSENYDVYALLEFDYPSLDLTTLEGLDVEARRDAVRDYYKPRNEQIVAQLGLEGVTVSYSAPFADINFDSLAEYHKARPELITASDNNAVEFVGVDLVNTEADLAEGTTAEETVPNYLLADVKEDVGISSDAKTGSGIKVGILEQGLPDTTNANFIGRTVVTSLPEGHVLANTSLHTTKVASILGGSNDFVSGIAPEVEFYCARLDLDKPNYTSPNNISSCLNWLLNEKYVNVINMSSGTLLASDWWLPPVGGVYQPQQDIDALLIYTKFCAYIDYTVATSGCLLIKSAGNDGEGHERISKPGMSIGVLTVGSSNANREVAAHSSYVEDETGIHKPEVVAPGENIVIPYVATDSGTSFATPVVTGIAALLMEEFPELKTNPALLKSVIMAGCERLNTTYDWLDDKAGFGLVNYERSREIIENDRYGTYVKDLADRNVGLEIFEGAFVIQPDDVARFKFSRAVLGENCELTNDQITPEMTSFRVLMTATVPGVTFKLADFIWDDSVTYVNYANVYDTPLNCKIQIFIAESDENPPEIMAFSYTGATHQHLYLPTTVFSNAFHNTSCSCGPGPYKPHVFPEDTGAQRYCLECGYREGVLSW